jgi:hypothetical protein
VSLLEQLAWTGATGALGRLRDSLRPHPLGQALPDQRAVAVATGLRGGLPALAGSEAEWYREQGAGSIGVVPLAQDLTRARRPVALDAPRRRLQPLLAEDFDRRPWGQAWPVRLQRPALLRGPELTEPGRPDPRPRVVQAAYEERVPADRRWDALWEE